MMEEIEIFMIDNNPSRKTNGMLTKKAAIVTETHVVFNVADLRIMHVL